MREIKKMDGRRCVTLACLASFCGVPGNSFPCTSHFSENGFSFLPGPRKASLSILTSTCFTTDDDDNKQTKRF